MTIKRQTNEEYHADTSATSASMLKTLDESPRKYESRHVRGVADDEDDRAKQDTLDFGSVVHCLAFEQNEFADRYAIVPKGLVRNAKHSKYKEWIAENDPEGVKTHMKEADVFRARQAVASLMQHERFAIAAMAPGPVETSHYWRDKLLREECRFRPDKIVPHAKLIIDLKTMTSWRSDMAESFAYQARDFGYYLQHAHYKFGAIAEYGGLMPDWDFVFCVVESKDPFRTAMYRLDREGEERGVLERERLIRDLQQRRKRKDWSEPGEGEVRTITLPKKFKTQGDAA